MLSFVLVSPYCTRWPQTASSQLHLTRMGVSYSIDAGNYHFENQAAIKVTEVQPDLKVQFDDFQAAPPTTKAGTKVG